MNVRIRKISFEKANAKIAALGNVLKRPLRDVLDSGARVAAISCARSSQPFGTGADAQLMGQKAVARDIAKVYRTPGAAYADITNPKWQAVFWKAFRAGEIPEAQLILDTYGKSLRGVPIVTFDGGSAHIAARNAASGRVQLKTPAAIVTNPRALDRYRTMRQNNVGFGKGGWADVARQISGNAARGLRQEGDITVNWITRKANGVGSVSRGGSDSNPTVVIRNNVRYASRILRGGAFTEAIRIARERMLLNLQMAVQAEVRALRKAA